MTKGVDSAMKYGVSTLAIQYADLRGTRPCDASSSLPQPVARAGDQSARNVIGAASGNVALPTSVNAPVDHVIRSLSSALEAVELERDEPCAEALRRAIAARLAALHPEMRAASYAGEASCNRRPIQALQKWRLKRVIEYVDTNLSNKVTLLDLAAVAGLSRMHFASQFRVATGLRPHEFLLRRRIRRSRELLRNTPTTIVEIALTVGFQTQAHFTTVFKRFAGCTPRQWRIANQTLAAPQTGDSSQAEITVAL
jgi:AraC family transcriptional regulator